MKHYNLIELMHAVLDGEATGEEARELEAQLARDAAARAQFDELRSVFEQLRRVPQAFPPEGLVAAVMAGVPDQAARRERADQPFSPSGVFEANLKKARGRNPGKTAGVHRVFQPWAFLRGDTMNEQKSGFSGKRKILVGSGILAAAVLVAVSTGMFPPSSDTTGTIVPAERYRAPQPSAADLNVGNPSATQTVQPPTPASTGVGNAGGGPGNAGGGPGNAGGGPGNAGGGPGNAGGGPGNAGGGPGNAGGGPGNAGGGPGNAGGGPGNAGGGPGNAGGGPGNAGGGPGNAGGGPGNAGGGPGNAGGGPGNAGGGPGNAGGGPGNAGGGPGNAGGGPGNAATIN